MFESIETSSVPASARERVAEIASLLRSADALIARAISLVGRGGIEAVAGLPADLYLALEGRRTGAEAYTLLKTAAAFQRMPHLESAFSSGLVSWGQVRGILNATSTLRADERAEIDALIGSRAPCMTKAEPDDLVILVENEVARRRPLREQSREDRAIKGNFLCIQGHLDGGGSIYGEADAVSLATVVEALDAVADAPNHPEEGPSRASQHFEALVNICEQTLAGGSGLRLRPRPRVLVSLDTRTETAELLWPLPGRPVRLTRVATDTLLCDATVVPVLFDGPHPVEVGDAKTVFPDKVRTAIVARDKVCRLCRRMPAAWCDCHHVVPGVGNTANDGCLLCRGCHRRVHRYKFKIKMRTDGVIEFRRRGEFIESLPP